MLIYCVKLEHALYSINYGKPSSWVHLVLLTLSDLSKEQVSVDGKGDVESNHNQSSKVQDNGHVLGTLHARLKGNYLK